MTQCVSPSQTIVYITDNIVGQVSMQMFPLRVDTEQSSLNYMKRLTAVAISNILYLRDVFPEECYGHRKLDNLKLRILTEKCPNLNAKKIVQWVKACFDAMEKKYLRQLIVGIYEDESNPNEILEAYSFRFTYEANKMNISLSKGVDTNNAKNICEESANSELRQSTVKLLRTLIVMIQSLDELPKDCFVTMKLLYYDDVTPVEYEPPGFTHTDNPTFNFNGNPIRLNAGDVITPFHTLKVKVHTNGTQFEDTVGSDSSNKCDNPKVSQELFNENDLLTSDDNESDEENASVNKALKTKNQKNGEIDNENQPWLTVNKERTTKGEKKANESNVITSKMQDMKVEDNSQQNKGIKRKDHCQLTQDSIFSSTLTGKRCKASEPKDKKSSSKKRKY